MRITSRYILRITLTRLMAATVVALMVLLLERLLGLLDLTVNADRPITLVFDMLINLVPHYMGIALPAAFFLGIWLAFNRLSGDSELAILHAVGLGLHRLVAPVMGFALILTLISAIIFGFLQPYGRYAYRSLVWVVTHASLTASLSEGAFVRVDDMTFMAERITSGGSGLSKIFVHQNKADGRTVTTTARNGTLENAADGERPVLYLNDGVLVTGGDGAGRPSVLSFTAYKWPIGEIAGGLFRARGKDERELTLIELYSAADTPPEGVSREKVVAEYHGRLVRILSMMFMPLLAIPLAVGQGRTRRSYGIVIGLLVLVVYQKVLQFGASFTALGHVSPWIGLWLPCAVLFAGSAYLFFGASFRVASDPLGPLVRAGAAIAAGIRGAVLRVMRQR